MRFRLFAACLAVLAVLLPLSTASAKEYIGSYDAVIDLSRDGSMLVTETIKANAEGQNIRRGIFRDFPLTFVDANGRKATVDFELIGVERDGEPEEWRQESISGGTRIYIGRFDVMLDHGEHTFQITYRTNRQIRYFADHDELYWNVTGNGWQFEIRETSATVSLPDGAAATDTTFFTGPTDARGKDARVMQEAGQIFFAATRVFQPGEGLTIAVQFPKGVIDAPTTAQQKIWWLRDEMAYLIGFGGLALVLLYYGWMWNKVGRDPPRGVLVPRWDAPDGISPALVNYIDNKGFSGSGWTALSATALQLAVRGYVLLDDLKDAITIRRTDKPLTEKLPEGETALLKALTEGGAALTIDSANGTRVQTVGDSFRSAIEKEHRGKYYHANTLYIVVGVILSLLVLVSIFVFGGLSEDTMGLLLGPGFVALLLGSFAVRFVLGILSARSLFAKVKAIVLLAVISFVLFSAVAGTVSTAFLDLTELHELPLFTAVGGIVLANVLFFFLMAAPTPLGAKMMDGIDGLRQYLTLAEKDRMNMAGAPAMSPQHFEKLLPYAVALGVEKPWSQAFETWLAAAAAGAAAASYQPAWYAGNFDGGNFSRSIGGFSSSMASTIASTIPAPPSSSDSAFSSSSGGGGGSSGGGGGGGGGGGW